MHFVIHALDRPDAGDLRASTRERHLDYLSGLMWSSEDRSLMIRGRCVVP